MNIAIIFAGGSGVRMGSGIPKQFLEINGKPVIVHTLQLFQYHDEIDKIYISVLEEYIGYMQELVDEYRLNKTAAIIPGGTTAQDSIYNALKRAEAENPDDSIVLLHDGVRPFVSYEVISNNIAGVKENGNAITCTACYETILLSHDGQCVESVPYRKDTFAAQAPQSFYLKDIIEAHDAIRDTPQRYENMVRLSAARANRRIWCLATAAISKSRRRKTSICSARCSSIRKTSRRSGLALQTGLRRV